MPVLDATAIDTANVITNIGVAGLAALGVTLTVYGYKIVKAFFAGR